MNIFTTLAVSIVLTITLALPATAGEGAPSGDQQPGRAASSKQAGKSIKKPNSSVQSYQEHEQKRREAREKGLVIRRNALEQGK